MDRGDVIQEIYRCIRDADNPIAGFSFKEGDKVILDLIDEKITVAFEIQIEHKKGGQEPDEYKEDKPGFFDKLRSLFGGDQ